MEKKIKNISIEEQLLQARERNLQEVSEVQSMKAHGKVLGMDTFSWVNPQLDKLATVIEAYPYPVNWIGSHDKIKQFLDSYPELASKIASVIVYDRALLNVPTNTLNKIQNVACVAGTEEALRIAEALRKEKTVLLFTSNITQHENKLTFQVFVTMNR
jgi:hypothetical protein